MFLNLFRRKKKRKKNSGNRKRLKLAEICSSAEELELRYVQRPYELMAGHIDAARYKAWPKVRQFLLALPDDSIVVDVGCANGKYADVNPKIRLVGCDVCEFLLDKAAESTSAPYALALADNLHLPFRDESFDALISVGVVHHFSTERRRQQALAELSRVVRRGGRLLVCVWAFEQKQRQFCAADVLVPWNAQDMTTTVGRRDSSSTNTTREQRIIEGSLGVETVADQETNTNDDENKGRRTTIAGKLSRHWGNKFGGLLTFGKMFGQPAVNPPTPADSSYLNTAAEAFLNGVSRFSPSLSRKLADYLQVGSSVHEDIPDWLTNYADTLFVEAFKQALCHVGVDEFWLEDFSYSNKSHILAASQKSDEQQLKGTCYRYYHVFSSGELDAVIKELRHLEIEQSYYDHGNWCALCLKTA